MKQDYTNISISHGTLRNQDLIPAFLNTIRILDPDAYTEIMFSQFGAIPAYVHDEGDSSDWWDSEDADYLREELCEILDYNAPEGYYFGTLEGDASDFGFWAIDEQ